MRARTALQEPDADLNAAFDLLFAISNDIKRNAPDLFAEASALRAVLSGRVSHSIIENREMFERIEEALDRLSAMLSEADNATDIGIKRGLWTDASLLAIKTGKFHLAVDLLEKLRDGKAEDMHFIRWHDQTLGEVLQSALKKDDVDSARYALEKTIDKISLSETQGKLAEYFITKQDLSAAAENVEEILKILQGLDNSVRKVSSFIRLTTTSAKVNPRLLSETIEKTAKSINTLPDLKSDDKPGTDGYKQYVLVMMTIDYNLLPVLRNLVNRDRNAAADFVSRIDRKEVRIIGDYVLLTDSVKLEASQTTATNQKIK